MGQMSGDDEMPMWGLEVFGYQVALVCCTCMFKHKLCNFMIWEFDGVFVLLMY